MWSLSFFVLVSCSLQTGQGSGVMKTLLVRFSFSGSSFSPS